MPMSRSLLAPTGWSWRAPAASWFLYAPLLGIVPFAFGTSEVRACLDMQALEDSLRRGPLAPEVLPPE
jgi:hypothetical protein